jgi:uncharacterized protein YrrD
MGQMIGSKVYVLGKKEPRRVGIVDHVLVEQETLTVVGFQVDRPDIALMLERKPRFLARDRVEITGEGVFVLDERGTWDSSAARRLGVNWDTTVAWRGMPVRSESGRELGTMYDTTFSMKTGELKLLRLSFGVLADGAVGVRDCPAEMLVGFDGESIVLSQEAEELVTSGGAAKVAGKAAAAATVMAGEVASVASDRAQELAKSAGKAVGAATVYTRSAAKTAAESDLGKRAAQWLKGFKDEIVDAAGTPKDDE